MSLRWVLWLSARDRQTNQESSPKGQVILYKVLVRVLNETALVARGLKYVERLFRLFSTIDGLWRFRAIFAPIVCLKHPGSEPMVENCIRQRLGAGWTFLDVGANLGFYSALSSMLVGRSGRVIALEPSPKESLFLSYACRTLGLENVLTVRVAAYSRNLKSELFLSEEEGRHSLISPRKRSVKVTCRTLDSLVASFGINKNLFLKIDVEGAEHEVLRGSQDILSNVRPLRLIVELHSETQSSRVCELLHEKGLCVEFLDKNHIYSESLENVDGDLLTSLQTSECVLG